MLLLQTLQSAIFVGVSALFLFFKIKQSHEIIMTGKKQEVTKDTILHLSTSLWNRTYADNDHKKKTNNLTLSTCLVSSFVEFCSSAAKKKLIMSQSIRGQGSHLCFTISPQNTNLEENVKILPPIKFR